MKPGAMVWKTRRPKEVKRDWLASVDQSYRFDNPKLANAQGETPRMQWDRIRDSDDIEFIESVIGVVASRYTCTSCNMHVRVALHLFNRVRLCADCVQRVGEKYHDLREE